MHTERYDDHYHIERGLRFLTRSLQWVDMNDPPFGEGLGALPLAVMGVRYKEGLNLFYTSGYRPETLFIVVGIWKSILFLPMLGVAFHWCRRIYGLGAGWLAGALLLVDPTFAAHIPLPTLDVLGVEGVVIGSFLAWRYFERPTPRRLVAMGLGIAGAMSLKHTAIMMPVLVMGLAVLWWVVWPWRHGELRADFAARWPARRYAAARVVGVTLLGLWVFTLLDVSWARMPLKWVYQEPGQHPVAENILKFPLPGAVYISAFLEGMTHGQSGHPAYLLGQRNNSGWWHYFPVVMAYKVPLGIAGVMGLGLLSLLWGRRKWTEWGLLLPMLVWAGFLISSKVNIGFRHFLPAYAFMLLLAVRCVARGDNRLRGAIITALAWVGVAAAGVHGRCITRII